MTRRHNASRANRSRQLRLRAARRHRRPLLERLEDRTLLAPVTVTITRIQELVNPDGGVTDGTPGDYYPKVEIDGVAFPIPPTISKDPPFGFPSPAFPNYTIEPYWTFSADVDPTAGPIRVQIQLFDSDSDELFNPDDHVDISPIAGQKQLILFVDPLTGTWTGDVPMNQGYARGNGDDDSEGRGLFSFAISTLSSDGDLDGDGLLDSWEQFGLDYDGNGTTLDLPGLGADPRHKDLFLEIDYMPGRAIPADELGALKTAFRLAPQDAGKDASPVTGDTDPEENPDGQLGINLWIDTLNGDFQTGGTQVDAADVSNIWHTSGTNPRFSSLKELGPNGAVQVPFDPDRRPVFRYALSAISPRNLTGFSTLSSGDSNGPRTLVDLTASWVRNEWAGINVRITSGTGANQTRRIVSNTDNTLVVDQDWDTVPDNTSRYVIQWSSGGWGAPGADLIVYLLDAGTLMHELGHTMNLGHGGGDGTNFKPNYISVMNYDHQFGINQVLPGTLAPAGLQQPLPSIVDFSPARLSQSGISTGFNTSTTFNDTGAGWTTNQWAGGFVEIVDGGCNPVAAPCNRQVRRILSNTATQLVIGSNGISQNNLNGNTPTTLTDLTQSWQNNQFAGLTVSITAGTGLGQTRTIRSNTSVTLEVAEAWDENQVPDETSQYCINCWTTIPNSTTTPSTTSAWRYSLYSATPQRSTPILPTLVESSLSEVSPLYVFDSAVMWYRDSVTMNAAGTALQFFPWAVAGLDADGDGTREGPDYDNSGNVTAGPFPLDINGDSVSGTSSLSRGGQLNGPASLTDNTQNWGTDQWEGMTVTSLGETRTIVSNDSNTLVVSPEWNPDQIPRDGDAYTINVLTTLRGHDDWSHISLPFRQFAGQGFEVNGLGDAPVEIHEEPHFLLEQLRELHQERLQVLAVTTTANSGPGSFRQAIVDASAIPGPNTIIFQIPADSAGIDVTGDGDPDVFVIDLQSPLPPLNDSSGGTTIDGSSQGAFGGDTNPFGPEIYLAGDGAGVNANGLHLLSDNNQVNGLVISGFRGHGILIESSDNTIIGTYIGTDPTGRGAIANQRSGILIRGLDEDRRADGNQIGVPMEGVSIASPGPGSTAGVAESSAGATSSPAEASNFGFELPGDCDVVGCEDLPVLSINDIKVSEGDSGTTDFTFTVTRTGDPLPVVSVRYETSDDSATLSDGDYSPASGEVTLNTNVFSATITVSVHGDTVVEPDEFFFVNLGLPSGATILKSRGVGTIANDDTAPPPPPPPDEPPEGWMGNLISANRQHGVVIEGAFASGNLIQSNLIGTDITGIRDLGNTSGSGVSIVDSSQNVVGGADSSRGNVLAFNSGAGVAVFGSSQENAIRLNSIFQNKTLGIDLGGDGQPEANDALDRDNGPNALQNFPSIQRVTTAGTGRLNVELELHSTPNSLFVLDFYASEQRDPQGYGEGRRHLLAVPVRTDRFGNGIDGFGNTQLSIEVLASANEFVTATAVEVGTGNTSEFSRAFTVGDPPPPSLLSLVVTNTSDAGPGSLRNAIQAANALPQDAIARIEFNIPPSDPNFVDVDFFLGGDVLPDVFVFRPLSALPALIRDAIFLDGSSQSVWMGQDTNPFGPEIVIAGNLAGADVHGLHLASLNNLVRGLNVQQFGGDGVFMDGSENTLTGNYIGTVATGIGAAGNGRHGVHINNSRGNVIGGATDADRNIVSGNRGEGIKIAGQLAGGNVIRGNIIGLNAAGSAAVGNLLSGIYVPGSPGTHILDNVVSGNRGFAGIAICGSDVCGGAISSGDTSGTVIQGNLVGTSASGNAAVGNLGFGISIDGGTGRIVGGTAESARNVVSASGNHGLYFFNGATGDVVQGNYIGTTGDGMSALGNGGDGVHIINAGNILIGGTTEPEANLISRNLGDGVKIIGGQGNTIGRNSIHANGGLGIDLGGDGVTPNDSGDADAGPNELQNYPVLLLAQNGDSTRVVGALNSSLNTSFTLNFYANTSLDSTGFGEGRRWLGSEVRTTDNSGHAYFDVLLAAASQSDEWVTATATNDATGSTSEFSAGLLADDEGNLFVVTNTNNSGAGSLRDAIAAANQVAGDELVEITFRVPATDSGYIDIDVDGDRDVFIITPFSALPPLTRGNIVINGESQQALTGDTNPIGPEIVLAGNLATGANVVDGLVSRYRFDGSVEDVAGGNEPFATAGISFVDGQVGQGVNFAPGGYIDITPSASLAQQVFTLAAWVRPDGPGPNDDFHGSVVLAKGLSGEINGNTTVSVELTYSTQLKRFLFGFGNFFADETRIISARTFETGEFYHVAATYDGQTFRLFVNGVLEGERALATTVFYDPTIPWTIGSTPAPYRAVGFPRTWTGVIDEVGIFNRALTAGEIQTLATPVSGLHLASRDNLVRGLNIQGYSGNGLLIEGDQNTLTGNYIGINATGDDRTNSAGAVLFAEDFEGDLSTWIGKHGGPHNGVIVADPLRPGNHVLTFTALNGAGDIIGPEVTVSPGQIYHLTFEYLGLPALGGVEGDLGGVIAFTDGTPGTQRWLAGTTTVSGSQIEDDPLVDDGQWHTYTIAFDPYSPGPFYPGISGNTLRIMLEDWNGSLGVPGDALFDNIRVAVSRPSSAANRGDGVRIVNSSGNQIGGTTEAERNVISNNAGSGITIAGGGAAQSLVGSWLADGNANDSAGIHDGQVVGAGFAGGSRGQAFVFDGVDDYVRVENAPSLEPERVTLSAWVNSTEPTGNIDYFVVKGAHGATAGSYALYQINGNAYFYIFNGTSFIRSPGIAASAIYDGQWHQLTGTYDGSHVRLYVDGQEIGTGTATSTAIKYDLVSSNDLFVGSYPPHDGTYNFAGAIDELALFSEALMAEQVATLFASNSPILGGNKIQGNYIGTTADGMAALGNDRSGVSIDDSPGNLVGGPEADARNIISGNTTGVAISGQLASGNHVAGNYIGLGADGQTPLSNGHGVTVVGTAAGNVLGGTTEGARNVISASAQDNVLLGGTMGTTVQGNYIGTDASGQYVTTYARTGIRVEDDLDSLIGGTQDGAGNVLSGNFYGIYVTGRWVEGGTQRLRIEGNRVGTTADGQGAIPNFQGIYVDGFDSPDLQLEAHDVTIGGIEPLAGNLVSANQNGGIIVRGPNLTGIKVQGNKIGTNLDGTAALPNGINRPGDAGLLLDTVSGVVVGGNLISGNAVVGVSIVGGGNHFVEGNFIGTTADGMAALGNGVDGIAIQDSSNNLIGGITDAARNVIGANVSGVYITGTGSTDNRVVGNYIGVGSDGAKNLGNFDAVLVGTGSSRTVIGGTSAEERNIISGSRRFGVFVHATDETHIQGNYVGLDVSGTKGVSNFSGGIHIASDRNTVIGGTQPGAGNVITGNSVGISIGSGGAGVTGTRIQGNRIGTTPDGEEILFQATGIYISANAHHSATDIAIGGAHESAGNVISGNIIGIHVLGENANEIRIEGNYIGTDVDGVEALANGTGIRIETANGVLVGGNLISGNASAGVSILGGGNHHLAGNTIGLITDGNAALGNAAGVIVVNSADNLIGGVDDLDRNVISASTTGYGVAIQGIGSTGNRVEGNYIGTDSTGTLDRGNANSGVLLQDAIDNLLLGNLISGNEVNGVFVLGSNPDTNVTNIIEKNKIGTDVSGTIDLGNTLMGVRILRGKGAIVQGNVVSGNDNSNILVDPTASGVLIVANFIGTDATGSGRLLNPQGQGAVGLTLGGRNNTVRGNVISANPVDGVEIDAAGVPDGRASGNLLQGNLIGVGADGLTPLGNGRIGIQIRRGASNNTIGSGMASAKSGGDGNVIAHNVQQGVAVVDAASLGNTIRGNSIHDNGGLGIDLAPSGVNANDRGDLTAGILPDEDSGPNTLQNFPEISSVQPGLETRVAGVLRSTPGASFVIDFYANTTADPSGHGEGQRWLGTTLGTTTVLANTEGIANFNVTLPAATYGGELVTATATRLVDADSDPNTPPVLADTSEFSAAYLIKSGKGVRGPNAFVLEIQPAEGASLAEPLTLDVELVGVASAELAGTQIDVETFLAGIQGPGRASPPIGLPFQLAARTSAASPLLLAAAAQGEILGQVELVGTSTIDSVPFEFARWSLDDASIGSFTTLGSQQDQFTLLYDYLQYTFTPLNDFGGPGAPVVGTWDVSASGGAVAHALPDLSEMPPPAETFRYFVNIPGIPGDSSRVDYAGWIEASTFEFSVLGPDRFASSALATTLNVVAPSGSASPLMLQSVADGVVFAAPIEIAASVDTKLGPVEVARWSLDQARIATYETASGLVDGFSIAFDALEYTVVDFLDDGTARPVTVAWDLAAGSTTFAVNRIDLDTVTTSFPTVETFVRVPGVQGPSQTVGYAGWIPVREFQFGVSRSPDVRSASVPQASSFGLVTATDIASPKLFELLTTGAVLTEPVEIALTSQLKTGIYEFARWTLEHASLGHFATSNALQDSFTLGFDAVQSQFLPFDPIRVTPPITGELDLEPGNMTDRPPEISDGPISKGVALLVNIPGIAGSSTLAGYSGWIPVNSFDFELSQSLTGDSLPSSLPFRFNAPSSQASPEIFRQLATAGIIDNVELVAVRVGSKVEEFARWSLSDVQIAGYATDSAVADAFSLSFASLEYAVVPPATKTGLSPPVTARWDRSISDATFAAAEITPPDAQLPSDVRVLVHVPGIDGPSQLAGYVDWIEVDAARLAAVRTREGRVTDSLVTAFQFLSASSFASPQLLQAVVEGRIFSDEPVRIATVRIGKSGLQNLASWELRGATIISYATDTGFSDGFSIAFDKIELAYTPYSAKGAPLPPIVVAWDLAATGTNLIDVGSPPLPPALLPSSVDLLLHLPGTPGSSQRQGYVGWIELDTFAFQVVRPSDGSAPAVASLLTLEASASQASPRLLEAAARGIVFPVVDVISIRDDQPLEHMRLSLDQVSLATFETADSRHDWLALSFDQLSVSYRELASTGSILNTATAIWPNRGSFAEPEADAVSQATYVPGVNLLSTTTVTNSAQPDGSHEMSNTDVQPIEIFAEAADVGQSLWPPFALTGIDVSRFASSFPPDRDSDDLVQLDVPDERTRSSALSAVMVEVAAQRRAKEFPDEGGRRPLDATSEEDWLLAAEAALADLEKCSDTVRHQ